MLSGFVNQESHVFWQIHETMPTSFLNLYADLLIAGIHYNLYSCTLEKKSIRKFILKFSIKTIAAIELHT